MKRRRFTMGYYKFGLKMQYESMFCGTDWQCSVIVIMPVWRWDNIR